MRILVVEDDEALARTITRCLATSGFAVDVARNGDDGLWRAREGEYDAITLDVMLPGRNGYVVCRTLREEGVSTPILMLTAKDGEYDEVEGLELGADDYLRKPFSPAVLAARVHNLVRRGALPTVATTVGPLTIDVRSRTCTVDGVAVSLTSREHAVLDALVRRSPEVVSKQQLLDLVWGFDFAGDPNIVEVYVGYLRRKLTAAGGPPGLITTVRGGGYRIGGG
jgi:two-component system, OmpR family, response regulator